MDSLPAPIERQIIEYLKYDVKGLKIATQVNRNWSQLAFEVHAKNIWGPLAIVAAYDGNWRKLVINKNDQNMPKVFFFVNKVDIKAF